MSTVRFHLLGPPELVVDGVAVGVETRKAFAVLAVVVVDGPQRRDALDALLWPDSDARRARAALRRTLVALRKALPAGWLADGDDVALAGPVDTDLDEVARLVGDGRESRDPRALAQADALHRDEFLAGLWFRGADGFEDWRRDTGDHLARRHMRLLEQRCRVHVAAGELDHAVTVVQRRLAMDPLHEPSHQQLMLLHAWCGDRAAAARQYAACVRVLDQELGVAPLARTTELDRAARAGTVPPPPTSAEPASTADEDGIRSEVPPEPSDQLVGRQDELDRVLDAHADCHTGGRSVVVVGEAGIGKTRLAAEVASRVTGRVVRLTVRDGESGLAYACITAGLRLVGEPLRELPPVIQSELARLVPESVDAEPPSEPLTSPVARTRLVDACASALLAVATSTAGPGLLVIDDIDRADAPSREIVTYLLRRLAGRPVLVLATARTPEELGFDTRIDLGRLSRADVQALAEQHDAGDHAERLHAESEGVPFLVVSYLAAWDAGATGWHLPSDGRALVRRRVAQLDEVARQVLTAAAVLGGSHGLEVLERVAGRSDDELVEAVEALVEARLLAVEDDGSYALTHDKVRLVVVDDTSHVRRRLLHGRAADALAAAPVPVAAATLARHLEAGGREHEAATAHAAAGQYAAGLYANAEAIGHLETALALGHDDPGSLLLTLGDLHVRTGDYTGAGARYTRSQAHGAATAVVEHRLGSLALRRGRDLDATEHLSLALVAEPGDELRVAVLATLAQARLRSGDVDAAVADAAEAVAIVERGVVTDTAVAMAHNVAGLVARRRSEPDVARRHLRASLAASHRAEDRAAALNNLALVLGELGALDEAVDAARAALDAGRTVADLHREAALLSNLADLLHAADRTDEAMVLQADAAARFAEVGDAPATTPEIWQLVDW